MRSLTLWYRRSALYEILPDSVGESRETAVLVLPSSTTGNPLGRRASQRCKGSTNEITQAVNKATAIAKFSALNVLID